MTEAEAIKDIEGIKRVNGSKSLDIAIKALGKQIAKQPLGISITYEGKVGNCPCCNKLVATHDDNEICRGCGQKLDWSEV